MSTTRWLDLLSCFFPCLLSIALIKHRSKGTREEKDDLVLLFCFFSTLQITVHHLKSDNEIKAGGSQLKQKPWSKLLTGFLSLACSACFSVQSRNIVSWTFTYQGIIKKMTYRCLQANLINQFLKRDSKFV